MAVDFCDYFWGEKHDGFHVLYHNLKSGFMATKDLADVVRETALIQENSYKSYAKISKQLGSSVQLGSFSPILLALKTASDKLSAIHLGTQGKVNELLKELEKYSVELHKKQKLIKDEESPTSDIVKALQDTTANLQKSKEFYKVKAAELEKVKRETPTPKELEKAETKFRKAQEDYKNLCDKYSNIREDFEKKMVSSCKHFQQSETIYLTQMVDLVHSFHEVLDCNTNDIGKVNLELEESLVVNTVEKMLEQFVLQKYTGLVKPGPVEFEAENISLTSLNATTAISGGGPPSDISDRSANSDKGASADRGSVVKKESTGGPEDQDEPPAPAPEELLSPAAVSPPPAPAPPESPGAGSVVSDTARSPYSSLATTWTGMSGFLKNRRKTKERKKSTKTKDDPENDHKDIGSDGEERGRSETPTPEHNDEDSFKTVAPSDAVSDPWADFNQPKKSSWSSSDSDSDDEEVKKLQIKINPVAAGAERSKTSASVDELINAAVGLQLNAATLPTKGRLRSKSVMKDAIGTGSQTLKLKKRPTPSAEVDAHALKKSQSTVNVTKSSHAQDLLGLFTTDINFETGHNHTDPGPGPGDLPGAESTRLDTSDTSTRELSREVSDLLADINNLNTTTVRTAEAEAEEGGEDLPPPELPPSQPPPAPAPSEAGWAWPASDSFSVSEGAAPSLPAKTRPASVQREKVASSLIPLPRPPSRARPEPRQRGTPSPTPGSLLQSTALSIHRSDSTRSVTPPTPEVSMPRQPPSRAGPLLPAPASRSDSPLAGPPPAPPPILHHNLASSRGPSPLALTATEAVPLAVAFQEVVHAAFRGAEESRCLVRLLGDMMLSFPAGIVSVFSTSPAPAPLQFRILNAGRLESVLPNKQLISKVKNLCTDTVLVFEFNMNNLQELLIKQSQMNPQASYFNIDILKYQITPLPGANSCPFHIMSYWRCEDNHTDLKIDYKYNQHSMSRTTALQNVTLSVPVDGAVTDMVSEPKGVWLEETGRALWKFSDVSSIGSIRARFQLSSGPGCQGTIAAQFNCEGTTLSGVEFELAGAGYRVSLVKRRFVSGKYVSEPDHSTDRFRYAAPPSVGSDC